MENVRRGFNDVINLDPIEDAAYDIHNRRYEIKGFSNWYVYDVPTEVLYKVIRKSCLMEEDPELKDVFV